MGTTATCYATEIRIAGIRNAMPAAGYRHSEHQRRLPEIATSYPAKG